MEDSSSQDEIRLHTSVHIVLCPHVLPPVPPSEAASATDTNTLRAQLADKDSEPFLLTSGATTGRSQTGGGLAPRATTCTQIKQDRPPT